MRLRTIADGGNQETRGCLLSPQCFQSDIGEAKNASIETPDRLGLSGNLSGVPLEDASVSIQPPVSIYDHLWQPGDQCKGEHPPIVLPVRGEVGRVAQAVGSYGEDDDAQELQ